jgi:hypothetical protein
MRFAAFFPILLTACFSQTAPPVPVLRFEDVAKQAGLTVPHISSPEKKYIIETVSGGVGFIDCDNDGKLDIVTVNGSTVDRYRHGGDPMVTLYHQDADLKFTDITEAAGLTVKGWGMGVAVADFDNDGWQDLYVTGFGRYVLYRNLGNCKFEDVTQKAGVQAGGLGQGAAWGDYDRDGFVDLFVARYLRIDIDHLPEFGSPQCTIMSVKVHCGPLGLAGETNILYRNRGDGTFEDVTRKAGVLDPGGAYGMQPLWFDYDNDGWPDLYVANDAGPNYLYNNKHDGTFEDVSLISGSAVDANGKAQGSMGVDASRTTRFNPPRSTGTGARRDSKTSRPKRISPSLRIHMSDGAQGFLMWTMTVGPTFCSPTATCIHRRTRFRARRLTTNQFSYSATCTTAPLRTQRRLPASINCVAHPGGAWRLATSTTMARSMFLCSTPTDRRCF